MRRTDPDKRAQFQEILVVESATHTPPSPYAIATEPVCASWAVQVTVAVAGSILSTVAPRVLETHKAPPPLTKLPGSPSTGMRSTTVPWSWSTSSTAPALGLATHTYPPATAIAPGSAGSCTLSVGWSERLAIATSMLASPATANMARWPGTHKRAATRATAVIAEAEAAHFHARWRLRRSTTGTARLWA